LYDGDSVVNKPDSAVAACVKIIDLKTKKIYPAKSFDAIFTIYSKQPTVVPRESCFDQSDMKYYNRLMNPIGDALTVRKIIFTYKGKLKLVYPIKIGGNRKE
jgi:hypothetical protein